MACQLCQALANVGCVNIENETLGDCPGSQLSLPFVVHFGSFLLVLPGCLSKIISLLRSLMELMIRQLQLPSTLFRLLEIECLLKLLLYVSCFILFVVCNFYIWYLFLLYIVVLGLVQSCLDKVGDNGESQPITFCLRCVPLGPHKTNKRSKSLATSSLFGS